MDNQNGSRLILPGQGQGIRPDAIALIIGGIGGIQLQQKELIERLGGLYSPDPKFALQARATFREHEDLSLALDYDATVATTRRGPKVWESRCLDTRGYTAHCAYCLITVMDDSVVAGLGDRQVFTLVLEGQCGSPFAELDTATINSTGRTGIFSIPLLASQDFSLQTRLVLYAADNATYTIQQPWIQRMLQARIDVVLVSGLTF